MAKFSTGLRNYMLGTGAFKTKMDGGFLKIYAGTVPATADAALGAATLICTLSESGGVNGLDWDDTPANGVVGKDTSQTWQGVNGATATATFFRFVEAADDGTLSTTAARVQGTVGPVGADMLVANPALVDTETFTLNYFNVALPTL